MTGTEDRDLETLFDAARRSPPEPSVDLLARIQADALAMQPVRRAEPPARRSWLAGVVAALGGWPAVAGLASVAVAGFWIGAFQADTLTASLSSVLYGADTLSLDPLSGFDLTMLEG